MQESTNTYALSRHLFILAAVFALLSFSSCKKKKHGAVNPPPPVGSSCKMDKRAPRPLIAEMRRSEFKFDWLAAKLSCEATGDSTKADFDVILRMRKDSAIWMLVTGPLNIKIARVLITRDSVRFIQYQDGSLAAETKCFSGDFIFLSQLLHTDVDFDMMQSLLVGNSAAFYEEDEKLKSSINQENCTYTLSTIRKRKLKKVLEGQKPPEEPIQTISLDPSSFKILRILFLDAENRTFTADYSDFTSEDSLSLPHHAIFFARGVQKTARLDITYKRITLNQPQEFPFYFPDDCKPILIPDQQQEEQNGQH